MSFFRALIVPFTACSLFAAALPDTNDLVKARDLGDSAALDRLIQQAQAAAAQKGTPDNQYRLALAYSYAAEVATEKKDKPQAEKAAESGYDVAQKLIAQDANTAEYHRLLGNLCGQVIPANPIMGTLKYGGCAKDEINKAIALDSKLALAYVSRGVGNYYLPSSMGGGAELALADFDKAIAMNARLGDAYLWKGIALRKLNRNKEAHAALEMSVQLSPNRVWAKEQLAKTPAQ